MNFVAIDFETANEQRSSPCSIGLAVVKCGVIVERISRLIRPIDLRFAPFCVQKHGITADRVRDEPEFPAIWNGLSRFIQDSVLVAHNASFDMDVLSRTLSLYEMPYPDVSAYCTMEIARTLWPEDKYGLKDIASRLGIEFSHHVADEDARACAEIMMHACREKGAASIDELARLLRVSTFRLSQDDFAPPISVGDYRHRAKRPGSSRCDYANQKVCLKDFVPECEDVNPAHPFFGRSIVFTGTLNSLVREHAMQRVVNVGGVLSNCVSKKTDYLVVGDGYPENNPPPTGKPKKAFALQEDGGKIEIIGENEFLRLLAC